MSISSLPCVDGLPNLLLVEPYTSRSLRATQLSHKRFCVTQTDSTPNIFLLRHTHRFALAVLSDRLGTPALCAAAESVRWQWPFARILILSRVPAAMKDQLYDDAAVHSVDETTFLSTIDKLAEDPWKQAGDPLHVHLQGPSAPFCATRAMELRESDPTKLAALIPQEVHARDLPSNLYRSHRGGYMLSRLHRILRAFAILVLAACSVYSPAYGQHMVRDRSGIVTDGHHEPFRGAIVQVHSDSTGTVVSYTTDRSGRYSFKRLEGDLDYTVWATWNGKRSSVKKLSLFDTNTAKVIDIEVTPDH